MSLSRKQVILGDQLISYLEGGSPSSTKPTLVFLHGWRSEASVWTHVLECFGESAHVVALDLPGFGQSELPKTIFNIEDYAHITEEALQKLGIKNYILIGHSFGGRIGIILASKQTKGLEKLVLVGSAGTVTDSSSLSTKKTVAKIMKPLFTPSFMQPLRKAIYKQMGAEDYLATPELKETFVKVINEDLSAYLAHISVPTLLLWGERDNETPLIMGQKMDEKIQDSQLVTHPQAGHFSFLDQEQWFILELQKFLS